MSRSPMAAGLRFSERICTTLGFVPWVAAKIGGGGGGSSQRRRRRRRRQRQQRRRQHHGSSSGGGGGGGGTLERSKSCLAA